jgi:hypothetical protein
MPAERYAWALLLAAGSPLAAAAADAAPVAAPPAAATLDAELLEFLGEFHDAKGEFVDPFVIDSVGTVIEQAERDAKDKPKPTDKPRPVADTAAQAPPTAQPEKQP